MKILSYRDLIVWQKAMVAATETYTLTKSMPMDERYGLSSQMRRAAISIPSNIAEGSKRSSKKDYRHFLRIAFGSTAELETQIELGIRLMYFSRMGSSMINDLLSEISKMLQSMITKLECQSQIPSIT